MGRGQYEYYLGLILTLCLLPQELNGNPMGWSEFEALNRAASSGDVLDGALFPLALDGSCEEGLQGKVQAMAGLTDNICYEIKSEGFLDTFSSRANFNPSKDHSCKYSINVENQSKKRAVISFRTGEMYFGGPCDDNYVKVSGLSHALGEEAKSYGGREVKLCNNLHQDKMFVIDEKEKNGTLGIEYKDFPENIFGGFRGEVCFF